MNENISLLISAIKAEAQTQTNELEALTADIFAILDNCTKTVETETRIFEYSLTFEYFNGYNGRKIHFEADVKKEVCKKSCLDGFSKPFTLEEIQAVTDARINEENAKHTESIKKAIEELYNADEICAFMQYLSMKIIPQFLRGNRVFNGFYF